MKVLVVDQFVGPSPALIQSHPRKFDELVVEVLSTPPSGFGFRKPELLDVDSSYDPPWATSTFIEGPDGNARAWKLRWNSD
jgi:hypothetical protein